MATLTGVRYPDELEVPLVGWADIVDRPSPVQDGEDLKGDMALAPLFGPQTDARPITLRSRTMAGEIQRSFFEDFYNRIYFIPALVDLGPISGTVAKTVRIWNAFRRNTVLQAITLTEAEGIEITGPALPLTFRPLAIWSYEIKATSDGPPNVNAGIDFDFEDGEGGSIPSGGLNVTGQRARLAPLLPNWADSFTVSHEFKTDIFKAHAGREQRRALRKLPRKRIEFSATASRQQLRVFNEAMAYWHQRTFLLPEIPRQRTLATAIEPGTTVAELTEDSAWWMTPDQNVVLVAGNVSENRRIASVAGPVVTFDSVSATYWPAGAKLHPAVAGNFPTNIQTKRPTNTTVQADVVFEVLPTSEGLPQATTAPLLFNSIELFLEKPNWGEVPTLEYEFNARVVDYGRGKIARYLPEKFSTRIYKASYTGRDFASMDRLREFFYRMLGQCGEFYMPTWEPDIDIIDQIPVGSLTLRSKGLGIFQNYVDDPVFNAVAIFLEDGQQFFRNVTDIYMVDDEFGIDTGMQLDAPLPISVTVEDVRMISWLPRWRHATDTLSIEWLTNSVGQTSLSMRTLEDPLS